MAVLAGMFYVLLRLGLGQLFDHEMSRWELERDQVLRRLARAMAARGVRPTPMDKGTTVWFHLPPLSIVVGRSDFRTRVFVGPSNRGTRSRVKMLEAFVEQALA
jgi:hypothetical protein